MKRLLCSVLALLLLLPCLGGIRQTARAETAVPSATVYLNGYWQSAKVLTDLSGDRWVDFPIDGSLLRDNDVNYVRITTNIRNGTDAAGQVRLCMSRCGWSNTYRSDWVWCDDRFTLLDGVNADMAIEGWNGTQWRRIHNDHDCIADTSDVVGQTAAGDWQSYTRNIRTDADTLKNYSAFRLRVHLRIGTELTATDENAPLFPAEHYCGCSFCAYCGRCTDPDCVLGHSFCTGGAVQGEPAVSVWVNGKWMSAKTLTGLSGIAEISLPIDGTLLSANATNYVRLVSNVYNGQTDETQLRILTGGAAYIDTFVTEWIWCDTDFCLTEGSNADFCLQGFKNGQWQDLRGTADYVAANGSRELGRKADGLFAGFARNIWLGTDELADCTNYRVRVRLQIGTDLKITKENAALFVPELFCGCTFCKSCGGCLSAACGLHHTRCTCVPPEASHDYRTTYTVPASCVRDGWDAMRCTRCGKTVTVQRARWGHSPVEVPEVPATCTESGTTAGVRCANCGVIYQGVAKLPATEHDYVAMTPIPPTETTEGVQTYVCTRCGDSYDEKLPCTACPSARFTDVDRTKWYHAAIDYVVSAGVMQGVSDTSFAPQAQMSRAMLVQLLYALEGSPAVTGAPGYTDTAGDKWYSPAVVWASESGLVSGYPDGSFGVSDPVTREQIAAVLFRYAVFKGYDTAARGDISGFADAAKVGAWARDAICWAVGAGLICGRMTDGKTLLDPQGSAMRAEAAALVMSFLQNVAD